MSSPETIQSKPEQELNPAELEAIGHEQREALREKLEKTEALEEKASLEQAQQEALNHATSSEAATVDKHKKIPARTRTLFTKHQRELSFKRQMEHIQAEMDPAARRFSQLIHHKSVEKISDFSAATVARPNALLAGSVTAFIAVTIVYLLAKHYGYHLSGFETIGAFVLGWILGLIYDYARLLITGKRS